MVKFLDGATEAHWAHWAQAHKLSPWNGFHEEHGSENSSNFSPLFQGCYKSITVHPFQRK